MANKILSRREVVLAYIGEHPQGHKGIVEYSVEIAQAMPEPYDRLDKKEMARYVRNVLTGRTCKDDIMEYVMSKPPPMNDHKALMAWKRQAALDVGCSAKYVEMVMHGYL